MALRGTTKGLSRNKKPRGLCRKCAKWIAIRNDGTLRGHGARTYVDPWCAGAGELPVHGTCRVCSRSWPQDNDGYMLQHNNAAGTAVCRGSGSEALR